jgi:hypothetical protein
MAALAWLGIEVKPSNFNWSGRRKIGVVHRCSISLLRSDSYQTKLVTTWARRGYIQA